MRTTFIFIAFAMCSVLLFNACKEESAGDALSLSQNSIEASVEGGKYEIDIKTDAAWTAKFSEDIDWATVTPESGTGTGYVTVIIKPNISESPRYARLEIVSNGITKRVDVDQDTGSGIAAITSSKTIEVAATGATYEFSLIGRGDWQTSATENWIKFEKKQGTGNKSYIIYTGTSVKGVSDSTLTIYANPNLTDAPRSAFIILQSNLTYDTITVTQPKIDFDYYKDGELLTLHTNPDNPNHGAPVVIVGDGWGVEDLKKGGLWEKWVKGVKDILLQIEMAKDFPDLIDVYAVAAISNYRGIYGNNRFGTVANVSAGFDAMQSFGRQAMNKINHPNKQYTTYIGSSNGMIGGFNLGAICALSTPDGEPGYVYWMLHEYFGHTFANLVDLYFSCSFSLDWPNPNNLTDSRNTLAGSPNWNWRTIDGKTFPACYKGGNCDTDGLYKAMKEDWNKGYGWMCDFTNDPAKVIWKDFIGKPGYANVGVYPTAWNGFCGLTGPEEHTAMRENPWFTYDVGSRYQVWKKVYVRSGRYPESDTSFLNLENFMIYDHQAGYDDNGARVQNDYSIQSQYAELFTPRYWESNNLYPKKPAFTEQKK